VAEMVEESGLPDWRKDARAELLQLQEDVFYTEKTHLASAEQYQRVHWFLGVAATATSTAAAATIVTNLSETLAGLLTLVAAILAAVLTFMAPEKRAEQHLGAGRQLGALRVRLRQALNLDIPRSPYADIRKVLTDVATEKAAIDAASPGTTERHFDVARRKIKGGVFKLDEPTTGDDPIPPAA
jgi:conjugal transfer/entry exclusion protein